MRTTKNIFAVIFFLLTTLYASGQVTSTFNVDADGWTLSDNNNSDPQTVNYFATGGNPGGYVSATKTSTSQPYFWTSPTKFGGNITYLCYGQDLSFDLQVDHVATVHGAAGDVHIKTPSGFILALNLPTFPAQAPAWSSYTVRLDETAGWRVGSIGGTLATKAQMLQYLSGVASLRINIKYNSGVSAITGAIDNVVLNQRTVLSAPVISSLSSTSAAPGTAITINGSGFDPDKTKSLVYFNGVGTQPTTATTNQLSVVIPAGAQYGPVTVVNLATGYSATSAQPFNPRFNEGGRIIPASFNQKFNITIPTGNIFGFEVADADGDGWNDLLILEQDIRGVSIYRNLGLGGTLSSASFAPRQVFTLPPDYAQNGIYLTDLDNDGKLDIATGHATNTLMSFATLRNTSTPGNLSFEAPELWPGLAYSGFLSEPFDVDGDGFIDLIAQHGNGSVNPDLWIAQNLSTPGDILFAYSISYFGSTTLDAGAGVVHGDLDGDGKDDLIVKYSFGGAFAIIENNSTPGSISFGTPATFTIGSYGNFVVADFNLDGKNDLAWKSGFSNDDIHIRLNSDADGTLLPSDFTTEVILDSDLSYYGSLSVGDVNGDGKPDLLATDDGDVGVFENVYSGGAFSSSSFVSAYQQPGAGGSTYPGTALAADLNGDNKPELVVGVSNTTPDIIQIYENQNVHTPVISLNTVSPLQGPIGSTVTITGDYFSSTLTENKVHFGDVSATVLTATKTVLTVTVPAGATYAPVRVTRNQFTASYHLPFKPTFSSGVAFDNSHFAAPVEFTLTGADYDIDAADLNEDGKPDIVAEANSNKVYVFRNTHTSGVINTSSLVADDSITATITQNPRIIDLNGDNKPDFVATSGVFRNISVGSEINFEAQTNIGGILTAYPADFNLDGKTDYVGSDGGSLNISVFENRMRQGVGAFISGGNYNSISTDIDFTKPAVGGGPVAADFDNDGFMDMASGNGNTDNMTVWRNNGTYRLETTSFTSVGNITTGDNPGRLYTGDLDVDGKMDIVVYHGAGTSATTISIFHNTSTPGSITFNRVDLTNPSNATLAHIDDLDGDGKPEIIVTSETGNLFSIFKNIHTTGPLTAASFAAPFTTTVTAPRGITTADINLDGKPEIILTRAPNSLLVYENLIASAPTITLTTQPVFTYACEGSTATFTVAATGTTNITYRWQKFDATDFSYKDINDGAGYSGASTATLSINTATTGFDGNGDYRSRINGDLATEVFSNAAQLTINSLPTPPDVTGDSDCVSPATLTLIATGASDGDYNWYGVATGGVVLGTNGSFTTPSIAASTTYYVSIEDTFCESERVPVEATISLLAKPSVTFDPPIFNAGPTINLCEGDVQKFSAPAGFTIYTWSNGEVTQEITIDQSGTYTVVVEDASGCISPSSDPLNVVINPYPLAEITISGTLLTASSGDNYQWHQNGSAVNGATSQSFEFNVLEYGVYTVDVTDNGCTTTSNDFVYLITGTEPGSRGLAVYPNAFTDYVYVKSPQNEPVEINFTDELGRTVKRATTHTNTVVETNTLSAGYYIISIQTKKEKYHFRMTRKN